MRAVRFAGEEFVKCRDRIMQSLRYHEKTMQQIADELFVSRADIRLHLSLMIEDGNIDRKFFHNLKTNRPDHLYSSVKFPARYKTNSPDSKGVLELVGTWDVTEFWKKKWKV
jgi:predicted ArsR family transcriptional regulator